MSKSVNKSLKPIVEYLANRIPEITDTNNFRIFLNKIEYNRIENNKTRKLASFRPDPNRCTALYICDDNYYFIESGFPELSDTTDYIGVDNEQVLDLYYLYIAENKIEVKEELDSAYIYDRVFNGDPIQYEMLREIYPLISIYKVSCDVDVRSITNEQANSILKKLTLKYICLTYQVQSTDIVKLSKQAIVLFSQISDQKDDYIPIDNVLRSILAYQWQFVFLDLYRCIERLSAIGWVHDYSQYFQTGLSKEEMFNRIKKRGMIYNEGEILDHLFTLLDDDTKMSLASITEIDAASFIYSQRNGIVHYQKTDINHSDTEWDTIIVFLLNAIIQLYNNLSDDINDLGDIEYSRNKTVM